MDLIGFPGEFFTSRVARRSPPGSGARHWHLPLLSAAIRRYFGGELDSTRILDVSFVKISQTIRLVHCVGWLPDLLPQKLSTLDVCFYRLAGGQGAGGSEPGAREVKGPRFDFWRLLSSRSLTWSGFE